MTERTLIRGGFVLSQDPEIGEIPGGDVLIEDDKIVQVGRGLSADGAKVIDAKGDMVIPGFIDTHRHTWETSIRTCAPDYALITYFSAILDQFAARANGVAGITPERVVRDGEKSTEILKLIDEDEDIATLVLAAGTGKEGPGPLVARDRKSVV